MKLSNQNIYNLRGRKNFCGHIFWGVRTPPPQKIRACAVAYECALSCVSSVSRRWLVLTNYAYYCIVVNRG
jgi:hypothetical protein